MNKSFEGRNNTVVFVCDTGMSCTSTRNYVHFLLYMSVKCMKISCRKWCVNVRWVTAPQIRWMTHTHMHARTHDVLNLRCISSLQIQGVSFWFPSS